MLSAVDGGKHPICFSQCPTNLFLFQSTHPSGVRRHDSKDRVDRFQFQSTHPSGVRHAYPALPRKVQVFQSTHPSGVRPGSNRRLAYLVLISIHAPQWGATMPWPSILPTTAFQSTHPSGVRLDAGDGTGHVLVISIHAPQWGATSWLSKIVVAFINFNPRTPVGCDT